MVFISMCENVAGGVFRNILKKAELDQINSSTRRSPANRLLKF